MGGALVELAYALGDVGFGDAVRKFGRDRTRRDDCSPDIAGLKRPNQVATFKHASMEQAVQAVPLEKHASRSC
jgi:hypothetical protein